MEFNPATYSVTEGEEVSIITSLNIVADRDVTVGLMTIDGTATGKKDATKNDCFITFILSQLVLTTQL